ncbi:MAG: ImmA/IrrE family metallo-endopeptidase [Clostridium sp.]|uniref:ImmA/IrrE family metallo-endopeptidase n=1 Tax=Clostridium sp. TaxID=1506 RepID=UPI00303276D4
MGYIMNIKKLAQKLIKKCGTNNPFEIADALGIWIYVVPLGNVRGNYLYSKKKKVFFINENLSEKETLFCIAHELGHAIMHTKSNVYFNNSNTFFNQNKHEIEADTFAAELLISDNLLTEYKDFCIEVVANCEGVDYKYLKLKFDLI